METIKSAAMHARGATGKGEVVAVVDSGVLTSHIEFRDRYNQVRPTTIRTRHNLDVSSQSIGRDSSGRRIYYTPQGSQLRHGTAVASLIAGGSEHQHTVRTNNTAFGRTRVMRGVAYDATVRFHEIPLGSCPAPCIYRATNIFSRTYQDDREEAQLYNQYLQMAKNSGAGVINFSFGKPGGIERYGASSIKGRFAQLAKVLEQPLISEADKTIVVWAAGNARSARRGTPLDYTSPELLPGLGVHFPELRGHVLAVVATEQVGDKPRIASFSNRCGKAKDFCIAAPGEDMFIANSDGDELYARESGTSFAAPLVSGALAALRQYFSEDDRNGNRSYQLGNTELVARLLATADRTGIYSDSSTYGHGMMDLDAATKPVGRMFTSLSTDPSAQPFDASAF
ncbi:MAG: S8 family serine peptidase, partial [Alphaproteobacteria bacterium]|nr:S8 family serine peptidase [Alphaproteobacteria bacterium]